VKLVRSLISFSADLTSQHHKVLSSWGDNWTGQLKRETLLWYLWSLLTSTKASFGSCKLSLLLQQFNPFAKPVIKGHENDVIIHRRWHGLDAVSSRGVTRSPKRIKHVSLLLLQYFEYVFFYYYSIHVLRLPIYNLFDEKKLKSSLMCKLQSPRINQENKLRHAREHSFGTSCAWNHFKTQLVKNAYLDWFLIPFIIISFSFVDFLDILKI
jgi:hypothetical protein